MSVRSQVTLSRCLSVRAITTLQTSLSLFIERARISKEEDVLLREDYLTLAEKDYGD